MKNNNVPLYEGLFIFRNAVLPSVIERLQGVYGKGWWKAGVERALGESGTAQLEKQFTRRYQKDLSAIKRPGTEAYEMLDIGHFLPIIQRNWKGCFADVFQQQDTAEVWLREIIEVRNAVAHPESNPLSDDDAWRALDTMSRFVRLLKSEPADEIDRLKLSIQEVAEAHPIWLDLSEGPYDYGQGLTQLKAIILEQEGQGSEIHLKLERHRDQLIRSLWEKKLTPGIENSELENRVERVLEELDRLAIHYLNVPFSDLCVAHEQPPAAQDALTQLRNLEQEISVLENELYQKQWKKLAQQQTGETIPKLERDITQIHDELDSNRKALAHLLESAAPPAYFSVLRRLDPDGRRSYVEGQTIAVSVDIFNKGRQARTITYTEGIPDGLELLEGNLHVEEYVEPISNMTFSYRCSPTRRGKYQLHTIQFEYDDQLSDWDRLEDTEIDVRLGTEPFLAGARYYHFDTKGLQLIVYLENSGDKAAYDISYEEEFVVTPGSWTV